VSQITEGTTLVVGARSVSADLEGEAVILDTVDGEYYGLNEVGARIWTLLQEPTTFGELVDTLIEEYRVDRDRCAAEVRTLLGQMEEKDLLEVQPVDARRTE
jgi:hypothetical protein